MALKKFNEALNLSRKISDKKLKLSIYYELGICYKRIKNYSKSMEMFESAKQLAVEKKIRTHVLYELGRVALLVGDFNKALAQFNAGAQISGKDDELFKTAIVTTQKERLLYTLYNRAIPLLQQKKYQQAVDLFLKINKIEPNYKDTNIKLIEAQNQLYKKSDVSLTRSSDTLLEAARKPDRSGWVIVPVLAPRKATIVLLYIRREHGFYICCAT